MKFPFPLAKSYPSSDYDSSTGFPTKQACARHGWPSQHAAYELGVAYQALYSNSNGIRDAWGDMWAFVAKSLKGIPNIIGFELINEPFAGNPQRNPAIMIPGIADKINLEPA